MIQNNALAKNIIKELGLDALPPERQEEVILKIGELINQRIVVRVLEKLSEAEKDEFEKVLSEKMSDQDAVMGFLKSKISDFDDMVAKEIADFKQSSLDMITKASEGQ